jgi:hypothetical protein
LTGIYISSVLNKNRVVNVEEVQDDLSTNILSSEVQFALLKESSCLGITEKTTLSNELKELAKKLSFMEITLGVNDKRVLSLKKRYTLLQIKDILLMKEISKKCNLKPINILYFYSNKEEECEDCKKQGYVLTKLSRDNPRLRVYSFDYDLDLPALKTLRLIKKVDSKLPAIVINDKVYKGFQSIEKIQKLLPKLEIIEERYLKNFDGKDSKVQIQCSEDSQCEISQDIFSPCGFPKAINIENKKEDIDEFSERERELTDSIAIKCASLVDYTDKAFCNKGNLCEVEKKK